MAAGASVDLEGPEGHHAVAVRRLRPGEPVQLTDGLRWHVAGRVAAVRRSALTVSVEQRRALTPPPLRLVVVQALARGGRDERAVEAMTEVGADAFVPWAAARCVARGDPHRWDAVVREAAKTARRPLFPSVAALADTPEVARRLGGADLGVVLHQEASLPLTALSVPAVGEVVVVVGPEGGLTEQELSTLCAVGGRATRLGPTVLRSSTAGIAAVAALSALSGRWSSG